MKIVIISNKQDLEKDYSDFIDNCDIVVRISKMDNIDSGLTGSKTDIVVCAAWALYFKYTQEERHTEELKKAKEVIFIREGDTDRIQIKLYAKLLGLKNWSFLPNDVEESTEHFTTVTKAVYYIIQTYPEAKIWYLGDTDTATRTDNFSYHMNSGDDTFMKKMIEEKKINILK